MLVVGIDPARAEVSREVQPGGAGLPLPEGVVTHAPLIDVGGDVKETQIVEFQVVVAGLEVEPELDLVGHVLRGPAQRDGVARAELPGRTTGSEWHSTHINRGIGIHICTKQSHVVTPRQRSAVNHGVADQMIKTHV